MRQGADRSPFKDRGDDLYQTPACATQALIRTGELDNLRDGLIWEPAAGRGAIVRELLNFGFRVLPQDLVAYDNQDPPYPDVGYDFLLERSAPASVAAIVTNPPYKLADQFIRHGLSLGLPVIVLLRLMAIEGANRSDLIDKHLVRVWAGIERLPFMHREGWSGTKHSNSGAPFAWFCFSPEPRGDRPIELRRMSWRSSL